MVINNDNNAYIVKSNFSLVGVLRVNGPAQSDCCWYSYASRLSLRVVVKFNRILLSFDHRWSCWLTSMFCVELNKYFLAFDVINSVRLICICLYVRLFACLVFTTFGLSCLLICVFWCVFFVLIVVLLYYFDPLIFFGLPLWVVLTPLGYSFHCHGYVYFLQLIN